MSAAARARQPPSPPFIDPPGYGRHRPERTLLYQLVEQHYPAFRELRAAADRPLPDFVQQEFDAYLKCGRLEEGFLRVRCEQWSETGAVTLVQRFGSALNLNVHFHMLFLDGVYQTVGAEPVQGGSHCMPVWTLRRSSARSSNACAAT
jgi:putative transposase